MMIMNAYEEYKTIIMAKSNTATAARARQEVVYGAVYGGISMYVYITTSMRVVQRVEELFKGLVIEKLLVRFLSPPYQV